MKSSWFNKKRILLITVSVVIIVALCVGIFALKDNISSGPPKDGSNITVSSAEDAATHLKELGDDIGYENALSELTEKSTTTIDGDTYYRLQQNYQGIPVYGRTVVYVTDENGEAITITGNVIDVSKDVDLTPALTALEAEISIKTYMANELGYVNTEKVSIRSLNETDLNIYNMGGVETARLAYILHIDFYEFIVDAHKGDVLSCSKIMSESNATIGYTASDNTYENGFEIILNDAGIYELTDTTHKLSVYTLQNLSSQDLLNSMDNNVPFDWEKVQLIDSEDVIFGNTESEIMLEAESGVQILLNVIDVQDYFCGLGFIPAGEKTLLFYNDGYQAGYNARASYVHGAFPQLGENGDSYGVLFIGAVTGVNDIDIIAHEYTHRVSRQIIEWSGQTTQNGALNEAFSDIFGIIIEAKLSDTDPDWAMEGDNTSVYRNIANPRETGYRAILTDNNNSQSKEEYAYSTVISHAAYLMSKDGSGLLTMDELAKLWYRAMLMMPSDCNFAECRTLVELAAVSMELPDAQIACIKEAFDTVGINNSETVDYELSSTATLSVYGADANLYSDYTMQIAGTQTIWNQDADPTTDDIYNYYIYFRQNTTTEKYYETRHIATAEQVSLDLKYGVYTITLIDDEGGGTPVSFKIKVGGQNGKDNLDIYTNFVVGDSKQETTPGTNTTEPDTNGTEGNANKITYYIGSTRGFSDGVAWVEARQKENGVVVETQWACIDTSGNVLFMLDPNTFEPSSFASGVSLCKTYDSDYEVNAYNIIDRSGNIVFSSTEGSFDAVIAYGDGYFAVYTYTESFREAGYTVFFMNYKGEVTKQIDGLRTKIPELINCGEGVFAEKIRQNADAAVTYRFYDAKTGNEYDVGGISSHKSMSYIFHNGYAVIEGKRMGDIPKLVSTDGKITELKQFGYGSFYDFGPVSDGGFVCTSYYQDKVEWVKFYDIATGTLTQLGNYGERVELNRATGFRFDNGSMLLPLVGADGKNYYTIVDKSGQSLFDPVVCKYADAEGDNRILVKFEDKTVAYNGRGEMIFELPAGQSVDSYQDGVARLVGSDYAISNTYIDLYGKPLFDSDILLFKSKK